MTQTPYQNDQGCITWDETARVYEAWLTPSKHVRTWLGAFDDFGDARAALDASRRPMPQPMELAATRDDGRHTPAQAVQIAAAWHAGEAAARLRHDGMTPAGSGDPDAHGAYQWADATGFAQDQLRSVFAQAFVDELEELRRQEAAQAAKAMGTE